MPCTWVEALTQPSAAMSVMRSSSTVSSVVSPVATSAVTAAGWNSKPFTTVSSTRPAGTSTVNAPVVWKT